LAGFRSVDVGACAASQYQLRSNEILPLVRKNLRADALTGNLFVFVSKNRQQVKVLVWDTSEF
jgi:hypothetical protein